MTKKKLSAEAPYIPRIIIFFSLMMRMYNLLEKGKCTADVLAKPCPWLPFDIIYSVDDAMLSVLKKFSNTCDRLC